MQSRVTQEPSSTEEAVAQYKNDRPLYEKLVEEVQFSLTQRMRERGTQSVAVSGRTKATSSFEEKIGRKHYKAPLLEIEDLAGVRIVCNYATELEEVASIIRAEFKVLTEIDKSDELGVERMGYSGRHFVVSLGEKYAGPRYEHISTLKCEIQVRTILQDAWALISHHLIYKHEANVPKPLRRELNNVAALLEVAQGVFDKVRDRRQEYTEQIKGQQAHPKTFLAQPVDFDTLLAYTQWKFPSLPTSDIWNAQLSKDLDPQKYPTLAQVDIAVDRAKRAVEKYSQENPDWFKTGTDYITKSLGFIDLGFRKKHPFSPRTMDAFQRYESLVERA